jgi:hypothetical protein
MQITHQDHYLCDQGAGSGALVSPGWWQNTNGFIVAGETVDTGLDENETELGILVLSVSLEMLADSDSLHNIKISRTKSQ